MTARRATSGGGKITVRQVKSGIGFEGSQKATLRALGLGKIGRERVHPDNPQVRGMVQKVSHLVEVTGGEERAR
jgi:large subunit ribosomal protein L30